MSQAKLARNTTYLTVASILQKAISFGYFAYLADVISEGDLGKYTFALTYTSVFVIFMDFGIGSLFTREVSKNPKTLQSQFNKAFSVKLAMMLVSLVTMFVIIHVAEPLFERITPEDIYLIYIAAIIIIFDTLTFTAFTVFRALQQLQWEAIGIVIYQTLILGAGVFALRAGLPIPYLLGALLAGSAVQFAYIGATVWRKTHLRFTFEWDWKTTWDLLQQSAPFAIAGIIFRINGSADSVMLKTMIGDVATGLYGIAFKMTFALTVLPGAFATGFYPTVSRYFKESKEKLHTVFESGAAYMALLSFPIVAGVLVLGDDIVLTIWDEVKRPSILPLWIFMVGLPFLFMNYPVGNFLNAVGKQRLNTVNMTIALAVNIIVNAFLIPVYSLNGAAIAATLSNIVLVSLGLPWVYKVAPFRVGYIASKLLRSAAAAAIMGFVLYWVQGQYHLLILVPLGAVLYGAGVVLTGAISIAELQQVLRQLLKRAS